MPILQQKNRRPHAKTNRMANESTQAQQPRKRILERTSGLEGEKQKMKYAGTIRKAITYTGIAAACYLAGNHYATLREEVRKAKMEKMEVMVKAMKVMKDSTIRAKINLDIMNKMQGTIDELIQEKTIELNEPDKVKEPADVRETCADTRC